MKEAILLIGFLALIVVLSGCSESSESGSYSCTYESRHTGCGGVGWSEWKAECFAFNMDDYKEGWTPETVCGKYTGSNTNCEQSCCIDIEYRNNTLSTNAC